MSERKIGVKASVQGDFTPRLPGMKGGKSEVKPEPATIWFAVASPGLHLAVHEEICELLTNRAFEVTPAGVEFQANDTDVRAMLPWLRATTRVWRRLAQTKARAFGELERKWCALPWANFIPAGANLRVDVTIHHCKLYHSGAIKERVAAAVASKVKLATDDPSAVEVRLLVRGEHDVFQLSVDASGERLNVRGYRQEVGKAPLRETLAAGMLSLCGWRADEALVDPMCGSGTIPIEAALRALRIPSGERQYAMDGWPCARETVLPHVVVKVAAPPLVIVGADRDSPMIDKAQRNAKRAQVEGTILLTATPFESLVPPAACGLLLFNPPYGHRIGNAQGMAKQFDSIGRTLGKTWRGWRAGILIPKGAEVRGPGCKVVAKHSLSNGGLAVELVLLEIHPS